jgi:hypothetical protein
MAFKIEDIKRPAAGSFWTSPSRICLTAEGELCEETDPRARRLLVAAGSQIPAAEAERLGLIGVPSTAFEDGEQGDGAAIADARATDEGLGPDLGGVSVTVGGEGIPGTVEETEPGSLVEDFGSLTKAELAERARERGVDASGTKAEIISRLSGS